MTFHDLLTRDAAFRLCMHACISPSYLTCHLLASSQRDNEQRDGEGTAAAGHAADDNFHAHLEGASALIDASSVSGTSTGVAGVYRAYVSSDIARSRHREVLRDWLLDDEAQGARADV